MFELKDDQIYKASVSVEAGSVFDSKPGQTNDFNLGIDSFPA